MYKNCREMGVRWCMKTTIRQMGDGVQKLPWDGWAMVHENHRWVGGRRRTKTAARWARWCTKTTGERRASTHSPRTCGSKNTSDLWSDNYMLFNVSSARTPHDR